MKGVLQIASLYDGIIGSFDRVGLSRLRRRLVEHLGGDILEVGVGTGLNLRHYGPTARVTGIDLEAALLRAAGPRARCRGYRLERADAQALPFRDASFDTVVSAMVFCSLPRPALALAEIRRVLRPGGRLHLLEHTCTGRPPIDTVLDLIAPLWLRLSGGCHINRDTLSLLRQSGWRIERHEPRAGGLYRLLVSAPEG